MRRVVWAILLQLSLASLAEATLIPDWSEVDFDPVLPRDPAWIQNPILDPHDLPLAFCADPFLFRHEGTWWLFYEAFPVVGTGDIALARSEDGRHWEPVCTLLAESAHLSYPLVFRWEDDFYLAPDRYPGPGLRLYRTGPEEFPQGWTPAADILTDRRLADTTLFRHDGLWWALASNTASDSLWLWYSPELLAPGSWREHPRSPIYTEDRSRCRPAGRVLNLKDGRLLRFAQRSDLVYGQSVRAFEIGRLDTLTYSETELPESPVLGPGEEVWNRERMHHIDAWWTGDSWLCAVDGYDGWEWAIGIYSDETDSAAPPPSADGSRLAAAAGAEPRIAWRLGEPARLQLVLYDLRGRRLRTLRDERSAAGAGELRWDGRDAAGRRLGSGLYLVRLSAGETRAAARVLLLR